MTRYLRAETRVAAPASTIYAILTDMPGYAKWNPWIPQCSTGEMKVGAIYTLTVLLNGRPKTVRHEVIGLRQNEYFAWRDMGWVTYLAQGERSRTLLHAKDGQVECWVEMRLSGPFAWLVSLLYGKTLREGMAMELAGLKQYAELCDARPTCRGASSVSVG